MHWLQVSQGLFNTYQDSEALMDDRFLHVFKKTNCTRLRYLNLRDSSITEQGLDWLMAHIPVELDISSGWYTCS